MAFNFPNNPNTNDVFTVGSRTFTWTGTKWSLTGGVITSTQLETNAVTTTKITDSAVTTAKIASGAVTAAKLGNDISLTPADGSITTAKIATNAVTQAKLSATLSAVTITTTANRDTAVPSPFTGQLVFLTDTKKMQVWDGSLWLNITLSPPEPPTSLSATALGTTSISVAFTAGADNGSVIANYKYALSTNGGSTYGAFTALDPADGTTPITISGLTAGTTYFIKLKAVNGMGDSVESSATSVGTLSTPDAPTNLSASAGVTTVTISFTAGANGGSAISNYQYALSTNGGSTYGSFTALNPADATSPITITGLTENTAYYAKLKAVNNDGAGSESSAVSFTTLASTFTTNYLVVAGGGGGGNSTYNAFMTGGGGAGGMRSTFTNTGGSGSLESALTLTIATNYSVTVGGGGGISTNGNNSVFDAITSIGGGYGGPYQVNPGNGGSGGGASPGRTGGSAMSNQGYAGGNGASDSDATGGAGGGGAAGVGQNSVHSAYPNQALARGGDGGPGRATNITGSSVTYAGGGGGGVQNSSSSAIAGLGGSGGGGNGGSSSVDSTAGTDNTGGGGGGAGGHGSGPTRIARAGGSGVVILRYPSGYTITIGAGLTADATGTDGAYSYKRITAGSGNVSWS